jgi:hypothetical protein
MHLFAPQHQSSSGHAAVLKHSAVGFRVGAVCSRVRVARRERGAFGDFWSEWVSVRWVWESDPKRSIQPIWHGMELARVSPCEIERQLAFKVK